MKEAKMTEADKIFSFSVKPEDTKGREAVKELKEYCNRTHKNFSALVVAAIKDLNEKLQNDRPN